MNYSKIIETINNICVSLIMLIVFIMILAIFLLVRAFEIGKGFLNGKKC